MEIEIDSSAINEGYHEARRKRLYQVGNIILNEYKGIAIVAKFAGKYALVSLNSVNAIEDYTFESLEELSRANYDPKDSVVKITKVTIVDY